MNHSSYHLWNNSHSRSRSYNDTIAQLQLQQRKRKRSDSDSDSNKRSKTAPPSPLNSYPPNILKSKSLLPKKFNTPKKEDVKTHDSELKDPEDVPIIINSAKSYDMRLIKCDETSVKLELSTSNYLVPKSNSTSPKAGSFESHVARSSRIDKLSSPKSHKISLPSIAQISSKILQSHTSKSSNYVNLPNISLALNSAPITPKAPVKLKPISPIHSHAERYNDTTPSHFKPLHPNVNHTFYDSNYTYVNQGGNDDREFLELARSLVDLSKGPKTQTRNIPSSPTLLSSYSDYQPNYLYKSQHQHSGHHHQRNHEQRHHEHHHRQQHPNSLTPQTSPIVNPSQISSPKFSVIPKSPTIKKAIIPKSPPKHNHRVCISCGSDQSPCWRPSWSIKQGQLCNSCGLRFKKTSARCLNSDCRKIPAKGEWSLMQSKGEKQFEDSIAGFSCLDCGWRVEVKK